MSLKLGDRVRWTSQAGGTVRTKEGEIVEVVPAHGRPTKGIREPGAPREHVSYVVKAHPVRNDGTLGAPRKYWPLVKYLQMLPSNELERAETDPQETVVVDVPLPTTSTRMPTDYDGPASSDTVQADQVKAPSTPTEDTLTDHGEHNGPEVITLEELKRAEAEWAEAETEERASGATESRKQAIIDAMQRKRAEADDEEDEDDKSNGERWER